MHNSPGTYDVVIVGAGLGGLLCANILSREGMKVCLLEKNNRLGGSIQSFARKGVMFNTGLNYTESLGEGETLNRYFRYFGVFDQLKIKRMDIDAYEKISFSGDGNEYPLAQGEQNFVERISAFFPEEKNRIQHYVDEMKKVCNSFPLYAFNDGNDAAGYFEQLNTGAYDYFQQLTGNVKLRQVLAGINSLYAGDEKSTPFYIHALIAYSFLKSAWRFVDGSSQLAIHLARRIVLYGGKIIKNAEVESFTGNNNTIDYVELTNGSRIYGKTFISNVHPAVTIKMLKNVSITKRYIKRLSEMKNTIGMFSLYIVFKKNTFPYLNYNHHHFSEINVWTTRYDISKWPTHFMFYTPAISKSQQYADGAIAMTYMRYEELAGWADTKVGNRGEDYNDFKRIRAEKLLSFIEEKFPGFRNKVAAYYVSTPLTYRDYTATHEGSSYGILKDKDNPLATQVAPRSKIKNLLFTGQNISMHGILGVSIAAVLTCSEILGYDYLIRKIKSI